MNAIKENNKHSKTVAKVLTKLLLVIANAKVIIKKTQKVGSKTHMPIIFIIAGIIEQITVREVKIKRASNKGRLAKIFMIIPILTYFKTFYSKLTDKAIY